MGPWALHGQDARETRDQGGQARDVREGCHRQSEALKDHREGLLRGGLEEEHLRPGCSPFGDERQVLRPGCTTLPFVRAASALLLLSGCPAGRTCPNDWRAYS